MVMLGTVSIHRRARKTAAHDLGKTAERASSCSWLQHSKPNWKPT